MMKHDLSAYEEYLTFYNDIEPYLEWSEEAISMANRIERKMNRIKEDKNILLYCLEAGDFLYEYENMKTFHIKNKIERKHIPWRYA